VSRASRSLDELGSVSRGRSRHRPRDAAHLYGGPYPFVQTADVKAANLYLTEYEQTYSEAGLEQSRLWPQGTLCITIAANIAETAILGIEACFPDSVIGFIPEEEKADARFVKYMFDAALKMQYRAYTQGAAQDNLSQAKLLALKFPVPDVTQQRRIADVLSTYDDLIENNRRRMALLEEAARQLYREWFVHLRFPGHEHTRIVDGVPEGWAKGTVGDLGQIITGKTPSTKTPENFGGNVLFVKTPDMHRSRVIVETEEYLSERGAATQPNKNLPVGTILVACIGARLGVVSITSRPCQTNQQINAVIPHRDYIRHYSLFALIALKPQLEALGGGATMPNVNKTKFASIKVFIPPPILLREFEDIAATSFQQIRVLNKQISCLRRARDLLLPPLMSGEIAV